MPTEAEINQPMLLMDPNSLTTLDVEELRSLVRATNSVRQSGTLFGDTTKLGTVLPYARDCDFIADADDSGVLQDHRAYIDHMRKVLSRKFSKNWEATEVTLNNVCFFQNQLLFPEHSWAKFHEFNRQSEGRHSLVLTHEKIAQSEERILIFDGIPTLVCTSEGFHNWGHFLVEDLPRIVAFIRSKQTSQIRLVLTRTTEILPGLDQQKKNLLEYLFPKRKLLFEFAPRNVKLFFDCVSYVTPTAMHGGYHSPEFFHLIQAQYKLSNGEPKKRDQKLFVTRRGNRKLVEQNESELLPQLEDRGFRVIHPEDFTGIEQAQLFSSAQIVVGLMGAAMANTIFCNQDTKVFYLSPDTWKNVFYWDLANIFKRDFYAYYGTSIPDETIHPDKLNYSINVARFLQFLDNS